MKTVGLTQYLPIDNENTLLDVEIPKPIAKGKDLLVQVKAVYVNPVDTKVCSPIAASLGRSPHGDDVVSHSWRNYND